MLTINKHHSTCQHHQPYHETNKHPHDFEVDYQILTAEEGGRQKPTFQGIRWDFWYQHEGLHPKNQLWMIWPEFLDARGEVITQLTGPVPMLGKAKMWIVNDGMRAYHQDKIRVGLEAYAHEGPRAMARYQVSKIVGLMTNPTIPPTR